MGTFEVSEYAAAFLFDANGEGVASTLRDFGNRYASEFGDLSSVAHASWLDATTIPVDDARRPDHDVRAAIPRGGDRRGPGGFHARLHRDGAAFQSTRCGESGNGPAARLSVYKPTATATSAPNRPVWKDSRAASTTASSPPGTFLIKRGYVVAQRRLHIPKTLHMTLAAGLFFIILALKNLHVAFHGLNT